MGEYWSLSVFYSFIYLFIFFVVACLYTSHASRAINLQKREIAFNILPERKNELKLNWPSEGGRFKEGESTCDEHGPKTTN